MPVIVQLLFYPCLAVVFIAAFLGCTASDPRGAETLKALFGRRAEMKEREQRHRQRMELLQQLEKIAALEGLAANDKGSEYAKLRDRLLAELDANLAVAAAADADGTPAAKERTAS